MNDAWQIANAHYLSLAVEWLRLCLARLAPTASVFVESKPQPDAPPSRLNRLFGRKPPAEQTPLLLPPPSSDDAQIAQLAEEMNLRERENPPPALIRLSEQLGLSRFESQVLLLCAAMELDTRIASLCARAQDDPQRAFPTFALALALFAEPAWEALSPDRPLRYWRLLEINQPAAQPLTASALRADERIVNYLKGLNTLDDRLAALLQPVAFDSETAAELPPSQERAAQEIIARWQRVQNGALPVAQLLGADASSKQSVAAYTARMLGRQLFRLDAAALPHHPAERETFARLWQRESILLPLALYLDAHESDRAAQGQDEPLKHFLARTDGILFLGTRENTILSMRANFAIEVAKPTPSEQQLLWHQALGERVNGFAAQLAAQFDLNPESIERIARETSNATIDDGTQFERAVWATCCAMTRPRLDALAQRIDPKATWDNLVLPIEQTQLLHQIAHQVGQRHTVYQEWGFGDKMNRGLGISALFAGESGTGKTMAAEVIANDLELNLYRIDLSAVVSKYIGETEKNLRRLFDAAEDGGAILFFDEADALFGKRSEVKDSHDRYANIEINYLLQRMEQYRGLAILATNMKSALDPAFMRRLRFIVNFPFPSASERKMIWQRVFPASMPKAELDYDRLARFNLTGGNIHSIALNAAFLAAQNKTPVTMPQVLTAMRAEFRKLDKPINEVEFRINEH
ncbi:MAG: ATP-binding protein [Chloroflexota bacterium]|nr:MAG: ATP-binding protein [Chloroflexota bacterium]